MEGSFFLVTLHFHSGERRERRIFAENAESARYIALMGSASPADPIVHSTVRKERVAA